MALLLALAAGMLAATRLFSPAPAPPPERRVVEVRGAVPQPGFHALAGPLTVHAALRAAGADPAGQVDAALSPGTRIRLSEAGELRLEPMDDLLVVGLPVDINRASARALTAIPGIGDRRAADIVASRDADGPYRSVDDLARVKGIGPATVEDLRPFLVAGPADQAASTTRSARAP